LLQYNALWGVGGDLRERHVENLRADFREVKRAVEAGRHDAQTLRACDKALLAMGILAAEGKPEERALLGSARDTNLAANVPALVIARVWGGLRPLTSIDPRGQHFNSWNIDDQIPYYHALAHRIALIDRNNDASRAGEREQALRVLKDTFEYHGSRMRGIALDLIVAVDEATGKNCIETALVEHSVLSVRASILSDTDDRVPDLLPALRSTEIDTPALAAVGMLDLGPVQVLQK
jgi:hypothetical protein